MESQQPLTKGSGENLVLNYLPPGPSRGKLRDWEVADSDLPLQMSAQSTRGSRGQATTSEADPNLVLICEEKRRPQEFHFTSLEGNKTITILFSEVQMTTAPNRVHVSRAAPATGHPRPGASQGTLPHERLPVLREASGGSGDSRDTRDRPRIPALVRI